MKSKNPDTPYHPKIVDDLEKRLYRAGYSISGARESRKFKFDYVAGHVTTLRDKTKEFRYLYETVFVVGCIENLNKCTLIKFYEAGIPLGVNQLRIGPDYARQLIICVCVASQLRKDVIIKLKSMRRECCNHSVSFMPVILRADSGRIITCGLQTDFYTGYHTQPMKSALKLLTMGPPPGKRRSAQSVRRQPGFSPLSGSAVRAS